MRIAYVFDPLLPKTETDTEQALNTISAFTRHGAKVTLFLPRRLLGQSPDAESLRHYYQVDGRFEVELLRSLYPLPPKLRGVEKVGHAVRSALSPRLSNYDLVYTRRVPVALAALARGRKTVYETYRPWPEQYPALSPVFRHLMNHNKFVGAVLHSGYTKDQFIKLDIDDDRLLVAHNGYEPKLFEPRMSTEQARAACGLPNKPTVLYAGRVTMGKGLGLVLDMAARRPDVQFVFVGSEGHGEVEERAESMGNVEVRGWVSYGNLAPYLFAADVLLVPPSLIPLQKVGNTVLPMKLFLYLAAGRPILAPAAPDTAELLKHQENGLLVPPDDVDAAVAAVDSLLQNSELAGRLASASLALAQGLTWDARAERVLSFLGQRLKRGDN